MAGRIRANTDVKVHLIKFCLYCTTHANKFTLLIKAADDTWNTGSQLQSKAEKIFILFLYQNIKETQSEDVLLQRTCYEDFDTHTR